MGATTAFDQVGHFVRVPVTLSGAPCRFLIDSGIGVTVVSSVVAARSDVRWTGRTFTGRRMSGQAVEVPLARLPRLRLGDYQVEGHVAGVADLGQVDGPDGFAGILGPAFFEGHVLTTDPDEKTVTVRERDGVQLQGYEVPLDVRRQGPSVNAFALLVLPSGREVHAEVDTGSSALILDTRFMRDCGLHLDDERVTTTTGTDETGHHWTRYRATVPGRVHLAAATETGQSQPKVMFQDIIHDGLVGTDYLMRYRSHFDVSGARLILSPRTSRPR